MPIFKLYKLTSNYNTFLQNVCLNGQNTFQELRIIFFTFCIQIILQNNLFLFQGQIPNLVVPNSMTTRYQTLDVSLNLNNSTLNNTSFNNNSPKKFNTLDFGEKSQLSNIGENDERVNKFRELYFKNEKLRKQLKLLNVRLNQKLQKVKLMPSKRKKAMSVDLNFQKPTKALQRQLQNAYNQVAMYKKQIVTLKVKQESESTYQKFKNLQNQISYKDIEITQVEAELKSIKNVKKMQDKTLVQDLQNIDMKQKLQSYERQFKQGQQKLKDIAKKARRRQQEYKKQQAYQVLLEKKLRKGNLQELEQESLVMAPNKQNQIPQTELTEQEFRQVRDQIVKLKTQNQTLQKRLDLHKKTIRDLKKNRTEYDQKYKQSDVQLKAVNLKVETYTRLIKDMQKKKSQQEMESAHNGTSNKINPHKSQKQGSMMKLDEIDLESEDPSDDDVYNQTNYLKNKVPFQMSQVASTIKGQREWKGKPRKMTFGFMDSNDTMQKFSGSLRGLKVFIDQSQMISGISFIYIENGIQKETAPIGNKSNVELRWQLQGEDKLNKIQGSLTQQGYLAQLILSTSNGLSAKFGNEGAIDKFSNKIDSNQQISGFYCSVRKLGQDSRITQLGFWLTKNQ